MSAAAVGSLMSGGNPDYFLRPPLLHLLPHEMIKPQLYKIHFSV